MCGMGILILIHDRETDKMSQYSSGSCNKDLFSVKEAMKTYDRLSEIKGKIKQFKDNDYKELKITYNRSIKDDSARIQDEQKAWEDLENDILALQDTC